MSNSMWERLGAVSGIVFVVLFFAGFIAAGAGLDAEASDPATKIAAEFIENKDQLAIGGWILLVALFFLFWFLGYLRSQLQRAEGEVGWLTSVAYGGGLVAGGMALVLAGITLAGSVISDYGNDPQVARTLAAIEWNWIWVIAAPLAALVGGTAVVSLRFAALPKWLGWISVVLALLLVIPPISYFGFLLFHIWTIAVSVVLLTRVGRTAEPETAS